jgi:hypothetical protein
VHKAAHPAAPALTAPHVSASGAGEIAYGMRAAMDAFASALQSLSQSEYHNLLHVLRIAATTACLAAMIAQPDKAAGYEEVLAAIRRMA